jgi:large subunit ribosomal protein L17
MYHRVKKIKFKGGYDATRMLIKKLSYNFLTKGKIETTLVRAKALKPKIESLVEKMKEENEKNKKFFINYFGKRNLTPLFFKVIGPIFKEVKGGYVRIIKLGKRDSDGADIAKVEWTKPVVYENLENKKTKKKEIKKEIKEKVKKEVAKK